MSTKTLHACDFCGRQGKDELNHAEARLLGINCPGDGVSWSTCKPRDSALHLCVWCMTNIQSLPQICGGGYECNGGPFCDSDHK